MRSRDLAFAVVVLVALGATADAEEAQPKVDPAAELTVCAAYVSIVKADRDAKELEVARLRAEVERLRALIPPK